MNLDMLSTSGMPGVTLRQADTADLAGLVALESVCFGSDCWGAQAWLDELEGKDRFVLVAVVDATQEGCRTFTDIVAAACFRVAGQSAELHRVMTSPGWRGLGLATLMLGDGFDWAARQGANEMLLEVRAGSGAMALYTDVGFTPLYERTNYYGQGQHALVMRCGLDGLAAMEGADHE